MKKKSLLLILLLALLVPWAANAQETLTVYDASNTNGYIPFYGLYADYGTRAQFIIPASKLEDLAGGSIQKLTFYSSTTSKDFDEEFTVYLKEVNYTTFEANSMEDWTTMTAVWTHTVSISGNQMEIEFDTPFDYNGGNLMIGFHVTDWGTVCPTTNWYGENQTSGTYTAVENHANQSHTWSSTYSRQTFIPKTTITYDPPQITCNKPETLVADPVNAHDATLTWTGGSGTYNVEYKKASDAVWTSKLTNSTLTTTIIDNLTANTAYEARVQSVCPGEESTWKSTSFNTPIACQAPTTLQFVESTTTTAKLSWTENGSATEWQICLNGDETNLIVANSNPFTIPGLTAGTSYTAKVRAYCDDIDQSTWSNTINFDTECAIIPALGFSPNFENFTAGATMPICWNRINEGTSYNTYPRIASSEGYTGSNCLYFYTYGSSSSTAIADQYAVLPEMSGLDGLQLTFMAKYSSTSQPIKIGLMTDPTDASTFYEIATQTLTTTYTEYNFMLSDKGSYVAIMMPKPTSTSSATYYVYIDDITIHTPPTCIKPTNLTAEPNALTATVTWESDESQWQVAHSMVSTADPDDNIEGTVNTKSYTKGNMDLGDHYFWVRSYCSTTDQSDWVGPVSVHIGYCAPNITSHDSNGITGVAFGTGANIVNHYDENGIPSVKPFYGDYSSMIGAVQAGVESTIAITTNTGSYPYTFVIWVDLDNSLSFEDSEVVYVGKASSGSGTLNANITIPATQALGDYRMRIFGADSYFTDFYNSGTPDWSQPHDPCADGTWRHACDFTLRLLEAPSCLTPTGLALNASGHTLQASWDGTATSYNININGTIENNVTTPYVFPVELSTTYTVKVQANCPGDQTSEWSNPVSYTTPECWGGHVINYTLNDSYGDGWNGASIKVIEGCDDVIATLTLSSGSSGSGSLTLCGEYYRFVWTSGSYDNETSFTFTEGGTTLFTKPSTITDGQVLYTIGTTIPIPTDLDAGTPGKHDAELSWTENGTATAWQICLDGDEEHLIEAKTNPFTLENLDAQTDYTVKIRAYIDATHQSCWSEELDFTTEVACQAPTNFANGTPGTNSVVLSWTENGTATEWEIHYINDLNEESSFTVYENPYTWTGLNQDTEYAAEIRAVCGGDDGSSQWSNAIYFSTDIACARPTNLAETAITTKGATLSWDGTSDSYVLEYRPWHQVGEDHLATGVLTTYNYDLSGFTGTGSIAIRHYDVSDMFMLNVDDIIVRNGSNEVIYSQDFESGSIPSNITNMDLDGDGNIWGIRTNADDALGNPSGNGVYCVSSASWISGTGAVFPDNWLIISGIEFGGSLSFVARGQDPEWPAENFAVYVSLESDIVEVPVAGTTYEVTGLAANTPYAWQVYGICGTDHSRTVSSFFKTLDDRLVFATDGNWNVLANWTDINGDPATALPTKDNNVRIDAEAIIPAGVIAEANKATINGGSITIAEGGQLKHGSATLSLTMYKGIKGYVDEDVKDHYYFISTPFNGVTLPSSSTTWSRITNLTDNDYDLYGFDATQANEEWVNWKSSSDASVFTSGNNNGIKHTYGYLYANSADIDLEYIGTAGPTNVNQTYAITYDPTSTNPFNGFVLVGNPFTCNAYVTFAPTSGTPSEIDFYVMNDEGNNFVLSNTSVTLAPMQGAFFYADVDGAVNFSSELPITSTGGNSGMLNMSLTQSQNRSVVDQARVRFGQGFNISKMSLNDNVSKLYIPQNHKDYAVVRAEDQGEMPVNFKAVENGTYTISFNSENTEFRYLHLIDNMTGNDVDLLVNPSYTFDARYTDYASRFKLVFATGNNDSESNFGFISNGNLMILGIDGEATLQMIDVTGRILSSETFSGSYNKAINAAQGVYMIRLIQGENVRTQKIVVK